MPPTTRRERLHGWLGLGLVALLFVDLVVLRVALRGRDAFAALVGRPSALSLVAFGLVSGVFLAHGVLALRAYGSAEAPRGDASIRSLQRLTGIVASPFLLTRLAFSPLLAAALGLDGYGLHQLLRDRLPTPLFVVVCCAGVAAVSLHLHQGLSAFGRRLGLGRHVPFAFLLAAAYFGLWVDVLAYFVTGRALFS